LLPKLYSGILICFSLLLFPAAIFTIALLKVDIDQFSQSLYYQLLAVAFLFIFLYNYHIQQWKAMPE
jgi:putative membrane protein